MSVIRKRTCPSCAGTGMSGPRSFCSVCKGTGELGVPEGTEAEATIGAIERLARDGADADLARMADLLPALRELPSMVEALGMVLRFAPANAGELAAQWIGEIPSQLAGAMAIAARTGRRPILSESHVIDAARAIVCAAAERAAIVAWLRGPTAPTAEAWQAMSSDDRERFLRQVTERGGPADLAAAIERGAHHESRRILS